MNDIYVCLTIFAVILIAVAIAVLIHFWHPILRKRVKKYIGDNFDDILSDSGFEYDSSQDIFVSKLNSWQRAYGYTKWYDEVAPFLFMIVDSEPIYFSCNGKNYLVELWKGQYGVTTGFEVGIYYNEQKDNKRYEDMFYKSVLDNQMPYINIVASKKGRTLFTRSGRHWWMTGFVLGLFSKPKDLSLSVSITFLDIDTAKAFYDACKKLGYKVNCIGNTVSLVFNKQKSKKVFTRNKVIDFLVLSILRLFCYIYNKRNIKELLNLDNKTKMRYFGFTARHRAYRNE